MVFDFDEYSRPIWIYYIYISAYLLIFLIGLLYIKRNKVFFDKSNVRPLIFILFFIFFAIFYCLGSDYFRYRSLVSLAYERGYVYSRQEQLYQNLAFLVDGNFELFRLVVWGGAIILTALSSRMLKVPVFVSLLLWFLLFYDKVCYARASLAVSVLLTGATCIISGRKKIIKQIVGIILCLSSLLFHRSMIIPLVGIPILFFHKFSRKFLFLYGVFIIIGSLYLIYLINTIPDLLTEEYNNKLEDYNAEIDSGRWERVTLKNYLSSALGYGLFYIPTAIIFVKIKIYDSIISPLAIRLYWFTFTIIVVATSFWFYYGFNNAYFYRVLYMTSSPLSIILAHLYHRKIVSSKTIEFLIYYTVVFHLLLHYTTITTQHIS